MKVDNALILRIDNPISIDYSITCAKSCDANNLKYEFYQGHTHLDAITASRYFPAWGAVYPHMTLEDMQNDKAACATQGHFDMWKKIYDEKTCTAILEHDAVMLQPLDFDVPDGYIVTLGYKLKDPSRYDHITAGKVTSLKPIRHHGGAHAYVITWRTAEMLLEELDKGGIPSAIDNTYFMRNVVSSSIPLFIADPTPAIGWLRKSTIWNESAEMNWPQIPSFIQNYK